jgi:hypothetical protein
VTTAELERLGPFFAVNILTGTDVETPWRPIEELTEPGPMAARIDAVTAGLAAAGSAQPEAIPPTVAASVAQLGLVARLLAPAIGATVLGLRLPAFRLSGLWWQPRLGGPFPLALQDGPAADPTAELLADPIEPITSSVRATVAVAERVLIGNIASAINSAAVMIGRSAPELTGPALSIARTLLTDPRFGDENGIPGPDFRRNSCCQIYRLSPQPPSQNSSALCGDCILQGAGA